MSKEVHEERTPRTVADVKEMLSKHSNGEIQRTIQNCITILQNDHVLANAHPEFPRIVFHGLRHSSATYQLMISGGDVKAVQGTTGHATADMLVNTYAHIQQSSRVELGKKFESGFYAKPDTPSPQAVPAEGEPTISMTALLELLKNADPEVKAQLRLALLT